MASIVLSVKDILSAVDFLLSMLVGVVAAYCSVRTLNNSPILNFTLSADPEDPLKTTDQTRRLGLIVCLIIVHG